MSPIDKFVNPNFHRGAFQGRAPFQSRPEKKVTVVCPLLRRSKYDRKKKCRKNYYDHKKKVLVICLAGARSLLQPEKKGSSRLSGG